MLKHEPLLSVPLAFRSPVLIHCSGVQLTITLLLRAYVRKNFCPKISVVRKFCDFLYVLLLLLLLSYKSTNEVHTAEQK